jgi:hypothetical protein
MTRLDFDPDLERLGEALRASATIDLAREQRATGPAVAGRARHADTGLATRARRTRPRLSVLAGSTLAVAAPHKPPVAGRRRVVRISAAAAAAALGLAGVLVGLTLSAASPQSAYAEARKAIAATSAGAIRSGRLTLSFGLGGHKTLLTTAEWSGNDISIWDVELSRFGARRLVLSGATAYVRRIDGTWLRYPSGLHYRSASDLGRLGAIARTVRTLLTGSRADQILALVPGLHKTARPDGTTVYAGVIPAIDSAAASPTGDTAAGLVAALKSVGHNAQLQLIVGRDGLVRQMSDIVDHRTRAWTVQYSQLGTTPHISPPDSFREGRGSRVARASADR